MCLRVRLVWFHVVEPIFAIRVSLKQKAKEKANPVSRIIPMTPSELTPCMIFLTSNIFSFHVFRIRAFTYWGSTVLDVVSPGMEWPLWQTSISLIAFVKWKTSRCPNRCLSKSLLLTWTTRRLKEFLRQQSLKISSSKSLSFPSRARESC